jgi:hypothetical protein
VEAHRLHAKSWGVIAFWLDDFGAESNTVLAYVSIPDGGIKRRGQGQGGTWDNNSADVELIIKEQ